MIKFFKRIRQQLLHKNKIGKYLLYAIGEIVLVIIGILIALNLNQRSEQKRTEAKIDAIFQEVMVELDDYIDKAEKMIRFYRTKDSLSSIILTTQLTYEDYLDDKNNALYGIPFLKNSLKIKDHAYRALMLNINDIPERYDGVLKILNGIYNSMYAGIDEYSEKIENMVYRNHEEIVNTYAWYTDTNKKNKGAITYRLDNFRFKNKVKRYREQNFNHWHLINHARQNAIGAYSKIGKLLDIDTSAADFLLDEAAVAEKAGSYTNESAAIPAINIYLKEGYLWIENETGGRDLNLLYLANQDEFSVYRNNAIAKFSANKITIYKDHEATVYTKVTSNE